MKGILSQYLDTINRGSLFFVYAYFGILKVIGVSPAEELVIRLHAVTIPFIPIDLFIRAFGGIEVLIGSFFLFPKITKYATGILLLHMTTTFLPLIFLPDISWVQLGVPTLTGQYILKNVVLIAVALTIYTSHKEKS